VSKSYHNLSSSSGRLRLLACSALPGVVRLISCICSLLLLLLLSPQPATTAAPLLSRLATERFRGVFDQLVTQYSKPMPFLGLYVAVAYYV